MSKGLRSLNLHRFRGGHACVWWGLGQQHNRAATGIALPRLARLLLLLLPLLLLDELPNSFAATGLQATTPLPSLAAFTSRPLFFPVFPFSPAGVGSRLGSSLPFVMQALIGSTLCSRPSLLYPRSWSSHVLLP